MHESGNFTVAELYMQSLLELADGFHASVRLQQFLSAEL
jgi:hypothetical protein